MSLGAGRDLIPRLFAVDAPRPDEIRFIMNKPVRDLPEDLESPRLGIVSPRALRPRSGERAALERQTQSGTGPFEVTRKDERGFYLARYASWWGSASGLGPALDGVEFRLVPDAAERAALLLDGEVEAADQLGTAELSEVESDPLLTALTTGDATLGLERSVRGIDSAVAVPSFSSVWLTTVGVEGAAG
jgi:ABC-type transport system substrate-binding protein